MINRSAARCIRFIIQCIRQTLELKIADEIAYSITMKQLVDLSACIFIEIEKKEKEKREKNGFDLGSPGSYYGKNTN